MSRRWYFIFFSTFNQSSNLFTRIHPYLSHRCTRTIHSSKNVSLERKPISSAGQPSLLRIHTHSICCVSSFLSITLHSRDCHSDVTPSFVHRSVIYPSGVIHHGPRLLHKSYPGIDVYATASLLDSLFFWNGIPPSRCFTLNLFILNI